MSGFAGDPGQREGEQRRADEEREFEADDLRRERARDGGRRIIAARDGGFESTPGPIAINLATYIGYKKRKLLGSILATLGMVLPSFLIIFIISMFLDHFLDIVWVASAFKGIKIAVGILIVDAAVKMFSKGKWKAWQVAILIATFTGMMIISFLALHISSLVLMILAALIGLLTFFVNKKMKKEAD